MTQTIFLIPFIYLFFLNPLSYLELTFVNNIGTTYTAPSDVFINWIYKFSSDVQLYKASATDF